MQGKKSSPSTNSLRARRDEKKPQGFVSFSVKEAK
jgi:hypothetical protein